MLNTFVNKKRQKELDFMLRIGTPIPVIECRPPKDLEEFFADHFTVQELIQHGLFDFVGKNIEWVYIRPRQDFEVFIGGDVRSLTCGEIVIMELGENGKKQFRTWMEQ